MSPPLPPLLHPTASQGVMVKVQGEDRGERGEGEGGELLQDVSVKLNCCE